MAQSAVVGILRVLLTANTAEFDTAMKRGAESAKVFSRDVNKIGAQATQLGSALTKTLTVPILGFGVAASKFAIDFESSFAGVRKTVDATEAEFKQMSQAFRDLSKTIPINVNELNRLGEAAGALGIPKGEIVDFARVMAELGVTTNVTADQAAESIAKIQNIFGAAGQSTENFASTLVDLGNKGASTEGQILEMATRLASAGNAIDLTQDQVLGIAAAISNVGIEAEAGGSAMSRVMTDIAVAVSHGGEELENFARIAGRTGPEFGKLFQEDAAHALQLFIEGLGRVKTSGGDLILTLEDLGFKEIRQSNLLRALAGNYQDFGNSLKTASTAWKENTALTAEAQKRFETVESKLTVLWNRMKDVGVTIGNALLPMIERLIGFTERLVPFLERASKAFADLPMPVQATAVGVLAITAAVGPALLVFGQLAFAVGAIAKLFTSGGLLAGLGKFVGLAGSGSSVVAALGTAFEVLTGPVGWIIGGTAALLTATGTWGDFFRILKSGAAIIKNVVVAAFREFIIPILGGFFDIGKRVAGFIDGIYGISTGIKFLGDTFRKSLKWAADFLETLELIAGIDIAPHAEGPKGVIAAPAKVKDAWEALDEYTKSQEKKTKADDAAAEAAKKHREAVQALVDKLGGKEAIDAANLWLEALPRIGGMTRLSAEDQKHLVGILDEAVDAYHRIGVAAPRALQIAAMQAHLVTGELTAMQQAVVKAAQSMEIAGQGIRRTLLPSTSISSFGPGPTPVSGSVPAPKPLSLFSGLNLGTTLPQSILAALTGGGNVVQATAGTIGAQIGTNVVTRFGKTITETLGKTFGGAINAVLPGIGALAGPLISLVGKLFGKSEESAKVSPLRDEFFKMQGGLETLNPKVQALAGNLSLVDAVFKAKTVDQYNKAIKDLTDLLGQTETASAELDAAIQKYGFSIEELGPKFRQQRLDELAGQLLKDYELLIASGIDNDTVLKHMAESFQNLASTALKTGTEIPENLKPALQRLVEMGLLVDENGDKLTDLSGINFSEPMSRGFDRVVAAINKLINALGFATDEAENLAQDRDFEIHGQVVIDKDNIPQDFPQPFSGDQPVYESFASGSGGIRDFGTGTKAILHGREEVLTEAQSAARRASGGMNVTNNFYGPVLAEEAYVEKHVVRPVLTGIRRYEKAAFDRLVTP